LYAKFTIEKVRGLQFFKGFSPQSLKFHKRYIRKGGYVPNVQKYRQYGLDK
jgi:hypothetical protein